MSKKELQRTTMKAIYRNDIDAFTRTTSFSNKPFRTKRRIKGLLMNRQKFVHVENEDHEEWNAFNALLEDYPKDRSERDGSGTALKGYMKAYKGLVIHVAAALDRHELIDNLLRHADTFKAVPRRTGKGVRRMLTSEDNQRRTILKIALDENHGNSTDTILSWIVGSPQSLVIRDQIAALNVMLQALPSTSRICMKMPNENNMSKVINSIRSYFSERAIPLTWPIIKSDFELLKRCVRQRKSFGEQSGPSLLHMAVFLYGRELLTPERKAILKYLIECADLPPTEIKPRLDDICNIEINGCIRFNGTAVHFALGWTNEVSEIHPGFEAELHRFSTKNTTQSQSKTPCSFQNAHTFRENQSVIDMVTFLRDQGADLLKPNGAGKSPLVCLPPDADPQLLQLFIDFIQGQGGEAQNN